MMIVEHVLPGYGSLRCPSEATLSLGGMPHPSFAQLASDRVDMHQARQFQSSVRDGSILIDRRQWIFERA